MSIETLSAKLLSANSNQGTILPFTQAGHLIHHREFQQNEDIEHNNREHNIDF